MEEKVFLVTGGASGIGAEICARLMSTGDRVVVADLNAHGLDSCGGDLIGVPCDITSPEQCEEAAQAAVDCYGASTAW